jgi:hypothetical protein
MAGPRNRTRLSTKKVRHHGASRDSLGRKIRPVREVLGPKALANRYLETKAKQKARLQGEPSEFIKLDL